MNKIYIFADLEGISGIYSGEHTSPSGSRFNEARQYLTEEINWCAKGLKAGGADQVVVRDGHGDSYTVVWDLLCPEVDALIAGKEPGERFPGLAGTAGIVLLGYHAMAGAQGAMLDHTFNSSRVQNYWINGVKSGETAFDAGIAGEYGIPVIMVSGDDKVCAEAKALMPWAETAQVKEGIGTFSGILMGPDAAHHLIYETAKRAVRRINEMKPLVCQSPVTVRLELTERSLKPNPFNHPWMKVIDGRTIEVTADTLEEAYFMTC